MDEVKLKVDEVAALLAENRNIVRNWLRDFREWIPVEKAANGYNVFSPEAVEKMKLIRHLYRERGFSTKQITHYFASGGELPSSTVAASDEIAELRESIRQLAAAQEEQNRLSAQIVEMLAEQSRKMDERDRKLTQFITERREEAERQKQLEPPAPPKRRSWWPFGK